jgi:hypothetical protein
VTYHRIQKHHRSERHHRIDWTELVQDILRRLSQGEHYAQILSDLYYGVEAELECCGMRLPERDVERLAVELLFWTCMRCQERPQFALLQRGWGRLPVSLGA